MRVSVFGLGYVGCVTAVCLAERGHEILGTDVNPDKVAMVNAGCSPIVEPGLGELLGKVVAGGQLRATASVSEAVAHSTVSLVCVGTPSRASGQIDTTALVRVGQEIGGALARHSAPHTVVLRSTVLPGTTMSVFLPALTEGAGDRCATHIRVAVNPEFMREGSSLTDFARPALTLVGCEAPETAALLQSLYADVDAPFVHTTIPTAEMVKYVANAFHALKVAFANEIGDVCQVLGVDAHEVMRVFRLDRRLNISEAYLRPGFAFGGSCLPKDLRALVHAARASDQFVPLLSAILPSNELQIRRGVEAVLRTRKRRVGVVGLSFKPGTDDLRESPMVQVVEALIGKGCDVKIYDPHIQLDAIYGSNQAFLLSSLPHIGRSMEKSLQGILSWADLIVVTQEPNAEARQVLAQSTVPVINVASSEGTPLPKLEAV